MTSDDKEELQEFPPEAFHQIIDHRTRIYENLANDALKLLSIQLLIIPMSLSFVSLLIEVAGRSSSSKETGSVVKEVIRNIDYSLFQYGIISGFVSILLATIVYHVSRKRAMETPNLLFQHYSPEVLSTEPVRADSSGRTRNIVERVESANDFLVEEYGKYLDTRSYGEVVRTSFDAIDSQRTLLRTFTTISLIGILLSALLIFLSLFKSIYKPVIQIVSLLGVLAILIFFYSPYKAQILLFIERSIGIANKLSAILLSVIENGIRFLFRTLKRKAERNPRATVLLAISVSFLTSGVLFIPNNKLAYSGFLVMALFFGVSGIWVGIRKD